MKKSVFVTLKKAGTIFLVCTLIIGLLGGSFGVVVALDQKKGTPDPTDPNGGTGGSGGDKIENVGYVDPVEPYKDATNQIGVVNNVAMLTQQESDVINRAVMGAQMRSTWSDGDYLQLTLKGKREDFPAALSQSKIVYIRGDEHTPWGCDRFIKVISYYSSGDYTYLGVKEPRVDEVFTSLDMAFTQDLTADNLVDATLIDGVSAHFVGKDNTTIPVVPAQTDLYTEPEVEETPDTEAGENVDTEWVSNHADVKAQSMGIHPADSKPAVEKTGDITVGDTEIETNDFGVGAKVENGDLIVSLDISFDPDDKEEDKDDDGPIQTETKFGIKGTFRLNQLKGHVVCDMPELGNFQQLYFGVSGEQQLNIQTYGKFEGKAESKATEQDLWLFKVEGLNEKAFPIAVFQFQGTTPIYITNAQFEAQQEALYPQLFVVLYANWEGSISLELTAGFDYSRGFCNGLRLVKDGQPSLSFENHPYPTGNGGEKETFKWNVDLTLTAHTDLTLFGGSLMVYIAGINVGEICVLRLGFEAEGQVKIILSSDPEEKPVQGSIYLRGYLKLIEVNAKLAIKDTLWGSDDWEVGFHFTLLEFELFRLGTQPDKYKPLVPISSKPVPEEFESVILLVCDVSGSMNSRVGTGETKLTAAKEAAKTVVESTATWAESLDANYGFGLVMFSDYAKPVTVPHNDYPYIKECIDTIGDGGGTTIYRGIDAAIEQLDMVKAKRKVILLMTDGQDYNTSAAKKSAQTAADKDMILFTVGFGNDVDEALLEELANIADGEYRYADTENMLGILQGFMYAQQEANGDVLMESEGTVSQGETTKAETFTVEDQQGELMVYTAWPGSFLDTILIDPNGREVDEDYPNVTIDKSSIPTSIIVKNPIPGEWKTKVVGVETSYENEPYFTIVSFMETETEPLNEPMSDRQTMAVYCMAIGFSAALFSLLLLICLGKKTKEQA